MPRPLGRIQTHRRLSPGEPALLMQYFGTGDRYQRARQVYLLMKARARGLSCNIDLGPIWRILIGAEWQAHARLERLVQGKLYRDHIFHPAAVAMLGWELLQRFPVLYRGAATTLEQRLGGDYHLDPGMGQTWSRVVEHAWLLAGFQHDHCCPYEELVHAAAMVQSLHRFGAPNVLSAVHVAADDLRSQDLVSADRCDALKRKLEGHSHYHAPISAVSLLEQKNFAKNDFARAVIDVAADAILWHHDLGVGETAYDGRRRNHFLFEAHPLRYLLVLCDGLHEFCRELLHRSEDPRGSGRFVEEFCESCTRAELEARGAPPMLRITYNVNCAQRICKTRWRLDLFQEGLQRLVRFIRVCGPLEVDCDVSHEDCSTCSARQ